MRMFADVWSDKHHAAPTWRWMTWAELEATWARYQTNDCDRWDRNITMAPLAVILADMVRGRVLNRRLPQ